MKIDLRRRLRLPIRGLLGLILAAGLAFGGLRAWIDSYRAGYLAERRAMAAVWAECESCTFTTRPIGPPFLIWLAGPGRAREFERVDVVLCEACCPDDAMFRPFRYSRGVNSM